MSFDDLFILVVLVIIVVAVISFTRRQKSSTGGESTTSSTPSGQVGDTLTLTESQAGKMREDIRYIQTSTVADQVSILDELRETSPDYRQYCELVGTTIDAASYSLDAAFGVGDPIDNLNSYSGLAGQQRGNGEQGNPIQMDRHEPVRRSAFACQGRMGDEPQCGGMDRAL